MSTGNLVIALREGRSVYIGRGIRVTVVKLKNGTVQLAIEGTGSIAFTRADSLREGRSVPIGRGISVTVVKVKRGTVQLAVEAPASSAITRDDFPYEVHLALQRARERGDDITLQEAREM